MGIKDTLSKFANKATDAIIDARTTYEKNCSDIDCYSLKNVRETKKVKGTLDKNKKTVEFSGALDVNCKNVTKPWFFLTPSGECFELDDSSIKQETIEVALKSKTEKHVITTANIRYRTLALIKK